MDAIDGVLKARYGDAERLEWDAPVPYRPMGHLENLASYVVKSGNVPGVAAAVREGSARDGSGTGFLFFQRLAADTSRGVTLEIGVQHVPQFTKVLPARVPHGNPLVLRGPGEPVVLLRGPEFGHTRAEYALEITLPDEVSRAVAEAVRPQPGTYRVGALTVNVVD